VEGLFFLHTLPNQPDGVFTLWDAVYLSMPEVEMSGRLPRFADDFRPLKTPAEVLAEVRRLKPLIAGTTGQTCLEPPRWIVRDYHFYSDLNVGVRPDTLAVARGWVVSTDPQLQWCGAEILVHSRAPEDVEALRAFAWQPPTLLLNYGVHSRASLLRYLHDLGVGPLPPLVKASPFFDRGADALWVLAVVAAAAAYVFWRRGRAKVVGVVWCVCMAGVIALGVRSREPRDAWTWGNFDVSIEHGWVYFYHHGRADAGFSSPLRYTRPAELIEFYGAERDHMTGELFAPGGIPQFADYRSFEEVAGFRFPGFRPLGSLKMRVGWWLRGPVQSVPLWGMVALLLAPVILRAGWSGCRQFRRRRAKGFPVQLVGGSVMESTVWREQGT
jgi:hypothetical protein